jgi:hypothetical protein
LKQCKRCREILKHVYKHGLCWACKGELEARGEVEQWVQRKQVQEELVEAHFTPEDPQEKRRRVALQWVTLGMAAMQSPGVIKEQLASQGMDYKNLPMSSAYKSLSDEISAAYKAMTTTLKPPTDEIREAMKWVNMSRTRARNGNNKKSSTRIKPKAVHVVVGEL